MKTSIISIAFATFVLVQANNLSDYVPNDIYVEPNSPAPYHPRIVGGQEAIPNSYPHSVAVYIDGRSFCGGSVIRNDVILTAAHCVDSARRVEIVAGGHNINKQEATQQKKTATRFVVHEKWNRRQLINDIALIHLSSPLTLNDAVQAIGLDDGACSGNGLDNTPGTVSGWGRNSDRSPSISPVLRHVTSNLMKNRDCRRIFNIIKDTHICLDGSKGKSSCNGDSGGALLGNRGGKKVEVGIVSFGSARGCEKGYPSAYTRVACFKSWVDAKLKQL